MESRSKVEYDRGVAQSVRDYCDKHQDQISSVDFCGNGRENWRYMAWLCNGWNQGDDYVHSVIADTAADLIAKLKCIAPCDCETCTGEES